MRAVQHIARILFGRRANAVEAPTPVAVAVAVAVTVMAVGRSTAIAMTGIAAVIFAAAATVAMTATVVRAETVAAGTPSQPGAFTFGRFGQVTIYRGEAEPRDVVLFSSGDGGWNQGMTSMAQRLTAKGAVVAGIDLRHYLAQLESSPDKCVSPAADFENLSHYLQSKLQLKRYLQPTLVGYSSGAALAYATLAGAPDGLFKGALSIGFCPDLDLKKPLCGGSGVETVVRGTNGEPAAVDLLPAKKLSGKWISLQGEMDQVCPALAAQKFMAKVPGGDLVLLPKVDHSYSAEKNWLPQYEAAYERITAKRAETARASALAAPVADLPLIVIPAAPGPVSPWFAIFLTGDGGWVGFDRGVAGELAKHNIPIIGWDSLKYFWSPRTPAGAAGDLDRVVRHFSREWGKSRVLLIGYSQGADTMPFMVNRLPAATHDMVGLTALLGISDNALFEFHVANWLGDPGGGTPTAPELQHWSGAPYLCLYGEHDRAAACQQLTGKGGVAVKMAGGHHFGSGYADIAAQILSRLPTH